MAASGTTRLFEAVAANGPGKAETLARLDTLATLLDSAFTVPGTRIRFGLDAVVGVVPVVGDLVSTLLSSYIIFEARRLGLPRWKIARMIGNVAIDATVGIVPLVGDVTDVFFKANRRNLRILREHLEAEGIVPAPMPAGRRAGPVIEGEYEVTGGRR